MFLVVTLVVLSFALLLFNEIQNTPKRPPKAITDLQKIALLLAILALVIAASN